MNIENPELGIYIYKNLIPNSHLIPNKIEKVIENNPDLPFFKWKQARVGVEELMPEYRNCYDFKVCDNDFNFPKRNQDALKEFYNEVVSASDIAVKDHSLKYNIRMDYREAVNFVKYGQGDHFNVHSDHGDEYTCTVSSVMYLNDDYEGGELYFKNFDYTYKPCAGDIVICPSNYLYAHASLPVKSGIKYSAVTMYDWTDKFHKQ
jgi:hypothetical protein